MAVDEGTETVYEILEEIVETASAIILNNYVKNQIYPYTVNDAKDKILRVIAVCCRELPWLWVDLMKHPLPCSWSLWPGMRGRRTLPMTLLGFQMSVS